VVTATAATTVTTAEVTTTSAAFESRDPGGRSDDGAAAARTRALYELHHHTVVVICRALLRNVTEAEDAAQQTFLSAHRAILNGVEPRQPAAWLAAIARNECWGRIKSRMREPLAIEVEAVETDDPVAAAVRRADLAALRRAIAALPPQQRDAVVLREFAGLRYDELAAALGVTEPAVESLLFRARTQLRAKLRAAYASVTGASALEWLVRAVAGGTPVAAKVAVLGAGTAAVTGSTVVVPDIVDRHRHITPTQVQEVHVVRKPVTRPHVAVVKPVVLVSHAQPAVTTVAAPKPAAHRAQARRGDDRNETTVPAVQVSREGPSEPVAAPSVSGSSGPGPGSDDTTRSQESSGSSGSGRDGHGDGSSGDGSSGGVSGDDGLESGSGGG
jgi:RNA polymerase sigma-70 factor (ECF subfamily)